jgi:tRNA threonylcarbamoyladenosine biosynthesis protein TsaB
MKLLAIDSSTQACSVAILIDGELSERFELAPRAHTQRLLPMVDQLLVDAGIQLNQLDAIGFGCGPGSFTGLRICTGAVQGLAFGADLPVVPVSTLAALAQTGFDGGTLATDELAFSALDARMDEIYWGIYQYADGLVEEMVADQLSSPENLLLPKSLNQSVSLVGLGDGCNYAERIASYNFLSHTDPSILPKASAVVRLAQRDFERGGYISADMARPVYLRNEVAWQKQR